MNISCPAVLAQLPQPLFETNGQTYFGPCYGLRGSRKRKRLEIAAAVDGETLNIYDVGGSIAITMSTLTPRRCQQLCFFHLMPSHQRPRLHAHHALCAYDTHQLHWLPDTRYAQFNDQSAKLNALRSRLKRPKRQWCLPTNI